MSARKWVVDFCAEVALAIEKQREVSKSVPAQEQEPQEAQPPQEPITPLNWLEHWARGKSIPMATSIEDSVRYDRSLKRREEMQYCQNMGALGDAISNGDVNEFDRQEVYKRALVKRLLLEGLVPEVVAAEVGWRVSEVEKFKQEHNL